MLQECHSCAHPILCIMYSMHLGLKAPSWCPPNRWTKSSYTCMAMRISADLYKRDYGHAGLYSHCHACAPPSSSKASVSTEFAHANLRSLETDHRGNVAPVPKGTCMWPRARHPQTEGHTRKNRSKEPETLMLTWAPLKRRPGHWMWHLACLPVSGFRRPRPDGKLDPEVP